MFFFQRRILRKPSESIRIHHGCTLEIEPKVKIISLTGLPVGTFELSSMKLKTIEIEQLNGLTKEKEGDQLQTRPSGSYTGSINYNKSRYISRLKTLEVWVEHNLCPPGGYNARVSSTTSSNLQKLATNAPHIAMRGGPASVQFKATTGQRNIQP